MNSIPWKQKIGLIVFGIVMTWVLLEVVLRLGGALFFLQQEYANRKDRQNKEYTILCLGESTTALGGEQSYPRQLERILNAGEHPVKVRVINKGIPATTTTQIVLNLPMYIKEYHPDMIISMMGINDGLTYIQSDVRQTNPLLKPFYQLRTVKLCRLLMAHWQSHKKKDAGNGAEDVWKELEDKVRKDPTLPNYLLLADLYRAASMPGQEFRILQRALAQYPENYVIWAYKGEYYKRLGDYPNAIASFQRSIRIKPDIPQNNNMHRYSNLAESYRLSGRYQEAEETFKQAITNRPDHPGAFAGLGDLYLEEGHLPEATALFEKQITVNPKASLAYVRLAYCYRQVSENDMAQKVLMDGIRQNPKEAELYTALAYNLIDDKKYGVAEDIIKHAIDFNLNDDKGVLLEWFRYCRMKGITIKDEALRKWFLIKRGIFSDTTVNNYRQLCDIAHAYHIRLVVVQYPMRALQPLRDMLDDPQDIVFVNNLESFKAVVGKESFDAYFSDRFAGDFGHCTPKGNALLANNIAQQIRSLLRR